MKPATEQVYRAQNASFLTLHNMNLSQQTGTQIYTSQFAQ